MSAVTDRFRALHRPGAPLLIPNPWDVGSARRFAALGFTALATTSSGFAATLGLHDGEPSREVVLAHCAALVGAVEIPVSADLESGFGETLEEVADTYARAARAGLAGASIEDTTGDEAEPIRDRDAAADRVRAAVAAAHAVDPGFVVTGRADNFFHGRTDLADTIARLQAYQEAGADVLYAPALTRPADIRAVVTSVDRPVNVLLRPTGPSVAELAALGVARISVGGRIAFTAFAAGDAAARAFLEAGRPQAD
ncbi:isocitrate lyase/phosphoenolpyruvate mutase family protein [Microbacterium kribbense]|uniref:Isocitrate lyase/phosphoenolpyruvate mutase family protein n=1 Tax=Microbacterium kribbense TaxID=433645 RepID=A0ABP7G7M8_9MICO